MTTEQREIHRKKRIIEYAERTGISPEVIAPDPHADWEFIQSCPRKKARISPEASTSSHPHVPTAFPHPQTALGPPLPAPSGQPCRPAP